MGKQEFPTTTEVTNGSSESDKQTKVISFRVSPMMFASLQDCARLRNHDTITEALHFAISEYVSATMSDPSCSTRSWRDTQRSRATHWPPQPPPVSRTS